MSAIKGALTRARTKGKPGRKHVGSPLQIRAKDVDIVELNKGAVTKVAKTQRGYNGVLKQFADFAEVEWSGESLDEFPKRLLTDEMMAKFLWYRAEKNPTNNAKATMAALASACLHHAARSRMCTIMIIYTPTFTSAWVLWLLPKKLIQLRP